MPYSLTLTYRLAGNLFSNQYYLPDAGLAAAVTSAQAIQTAQAALQTADVEYVTAILVDQLSPYASHPVVIGANRGTVAGQPTAPAITFLEFVFYPLANRGKTTHRIRGYAANDFTDLSVWSVNSGARGDYDNNAGSALVDTSYAGYTAVVANLSVDRNNQSLVPSERVSIGSKRATSRL
jgi:hypothetical protein